MMHNCEFHQLLNGKSPSRLPMSSKSNPGVLEDRLVPDTVDIGVNMLRYVLWSNTVNFINFWVEKVHQDSLCPRSPTLESWRTGWFLIPLTLVSMFLEMHSKHILKVSFNSDMHNTFKTHYFLYVWLWGLGWRGNLDMEYGMWGVI